MAGRTGSLARLAVALALLAPSLLAGEVVPATRQLELMPPPQASQFSTDAYIAATAVDLGAAGFAVGWHLNINPINPESVKGLAQGRRILPNGHPAETFLASTDVFVPGRAMDISLAAVGKTGRFVAVWSQLNDFFSGNVWFRRFENGQPLDQGAVRITEVIDGRSDCNPRVAANGGGRFVMVWKRGPSYQGGDQGKETTSRILARVFGPDGLPLTPEIAVTEPVPASTACNDDADHPEVGMDAAGNFVVLWAGADAGSGISGRRFDPAGQPLGEPFRIGGRGGAVNLAMLPSGELVVAWQAPRQTGVTLLSRFTAEGRRTGALVRVAGQDTRMAIDRSGRVALFWLDGNRAALQVFDASLARLSPVLLDPPVTTADPRYYTHGGVAFADDGRILTVWVGPRGRKVPDSILGRIWQVRAGGGS